jgi:hypothetical protein
MDGLFIELLEGLIFQYKYLIFMWMFPGYSSKASIGKGKVDKPGKLYELDG